MAYDGQHSWSPDGTRIVFISGRDGNDEVYVMDADGSNQRNLTNDPRDDYEPAWSPDGTRIVFIMWEGQPQCCGPGGLFVINVDGSSLRALLRIDYIWMYILSAPRWSPDGTTIAYTLQWKYYSPYLHLINADGTGDRLVFPWVPPLPTSFYGLPGAQGHVWSPDGGMLAYAYSGDYRMNRSLRLRVMNADGTIRTLGMREPNDVPREDTDPGWSPDGSRLAFTRTRQGRAPQVYVIPIDRSSGETPLTSSGEPSSDPVWRP